MGVKPANENTST